MLEILKFASESLSNYATFMITALISYFLFITATSIIIDKITIAIISIKTAHSDDFDDDAKE